MAQIKIPLGPRQPLEILYSYPNIPDSSETLEKTIEHWFGQTLNRDGLKADMAKVTSPDGANYFLEINGPTEEQNDAYAERLGKIYKAGWKCWNKTIPLIKAHGKWDPDNTGHWRFFLTWGVGLVSHQSLQFFHYPPERLLNPLRDSMMDPVTFRCRDLLQVNMQAFGIKNETYVYETRINSSPIAAPDDQGTSPDSPHCDPVWGGLIPIEFFKEFEQSMISALLKPHPTKDGYTIPMIVYGGPATQRFGGMWLQPDTALIVEVLPGLKTPVLGSAHPYHLYYWGQDANLGKTDPNWGVGCGRLIPDAVIPGISEKVLGFQRGDLAVAGWQVRMAQDPSQDPWKVLEEVEAHWNHADQQSLVAALTKRHGSLYYEDYPTGNKFSFKLTLEEALER